MITENRLFMERNIEALDKWCGANGMYLNINKCGYMVVNGANDQLLSFRNEAFPSVTEYTYLGVPFTNTLNIMRVIQDRKDKARRALFGMQGFLCNRNIIWPLKIKLIKSVLVPVATYASELYGMAASRVKPLQQVVDKGLRMASLTRRNVNLVSLYEELKIDSIENRTDKHRARALFKWRKSRT